MRIVLDAETCARGLRRIAGEIIERHGAQHLALVGIRRGGVPLAAEIARWVLELEGHQPVLGSIDITLYRDDAATALPNPRIGPSEMPFDIAGKTVVIVDDVVYTARTVRAAIDGVLDHGRPERIELATMIDRGGRELPIQPDYVVRRVDVQDDERVDVFETDDGFIAAIQMKNAPSARAPAPAALRDPS